MDIQNDVSLTGPETSSRSNAASLGQEDFLKMLIAQLEHQDPLNPQDSTEFTAQLATFSSLEQEIGMRETLEQIAASLNVGDKGTAIDMIGKEVLAESPAFEGGPDGATLHFDLAGATDFTRISILNSEGGLVNSFDLGAQEAGIGSFTWNGMNRFGNPAPADVYQVSIEATSDLLPISATPLVEARVTSANVSASNPFLYLGDLVVPLSGVREVRAAPSLQPAP